MVAAAVRTPLEPVFILRTLAQRPAALGLAAGAWGMGMVLGSGIAAHAQPPGPRQRMLAGGVALVGVAVVASSAATSLEPVLALFMIAGLGNAVAVISYQSLLQEWTPDRLRGRVVAASEAVLDCSLIIGALMAATLAGLLGVRGGMAASGAGFLVAAVLAGRLLGGAVVPERESRVETAPVAAAARWRARRRRAATLLTGASEGGPSRGGDGVDYRTSELASSNGDLGARAVPHGSRRRAAPMAGQAA